MSFLSEFSRQTALLLPSLTTETFMETLARLFKELAPIDNVSIVSYPDMHLPRIEYNDIPPGRRGSTIDLFLKGAFLLDPYYLAAKRGKSGFFHLNELAPSGFQESEYYRIYYQSSGLTDECGYLVQLGERDNNFINISLGQINVPDPFTEDDLRHLSEITPLVEALTIYHWQQQDRQPGPQHNLRNQLDTALECFGKSMLTEREGQMVQMILHGYSTKAISERLEISVETVKLHRKNAYAKLDIGTQGELFHLFIDSLMSIDSYQGGDPLIPYHSPTNEGS